MRSALAYEAAKVLSPQVGIRETLVLFVAVKEHKLSCYSKRNPLFTSPEQGYKATVHQLTLSSQTDRGGRLMLQRFRIWGLGMSAMKTTLLFLLTKAQHFEATGLKPE